MLIFRMCQTLVDVISLLLC